MNAPVSGNSLSPSKSKLTVLERVQAQVYKNRIRIKEWFVDYDKLRKGLVTPTQFCAAIDNAGIRLNSAQREDLWTMYLLPVDDLHPTEELVNYRLFCEEVDSVFTTRGLEKMPQHEVEPEPTQLLDRTRYQKNSTILTVEKETALDDILEYCRTQCRQKISNVKAAFDDPAENRNSPSLVSHVTHQQFRQVLFNNLGLDQLSEQDFLLLIEKFKSDDYDDMVNYVVFANEIDQDVDEVIEYDVPPNIR